MNSKRVRSKSDDSARIYVGLDLHKNYLRFLLDRKLKKSRKNEIVIESSSTWYHVYGLLSEDLHNHLTLSNPVKTIVRESLE
ncbi:MAG: hypothetical protein M1587_06395 [Thaumarchaeota archaeon]|nr:hypothetical protein [Nitrososphaerota archaeon]